MRKALFGRGLLGAGAVAIGVLLACGAGTTGCAADAGPASSTATLKEGINVLSSNPSVGVSVAFKQNGRVVYLDTKVGKLKEQVYREAFPKDPLYEMDARVVDQEGHTFSLVIGGDKLIDPTWATDLVATQMHDITTPAEQLQRDADFALARDAAKAFAAVATPELADHVYHFTNMTARVPSEDATLQARRLATKLPEVVDYSTCTPTYAQYADLYTIALGTGEGDVDGILGKIAQYITGAEHSTTWAYQINSCSGGWVSALVACNHGNCANTSGMSLSCYSGSGAQGPNPPTVYFSNANVFSYWSYETNQTSAGVNGACSSNYGIDLADITWYGGGDANHVCNDDSAEELDEIRYARTDNGSWSGGGGGWNGSFSCQHWTHWYGPLDTDGTAPNCP